MSDDLASCPCPLANDKPVGTMVTPEIAAEAVRAHNAGLLRQANCRHEWRRVADIGEWLTGYGAPATDPRLPVREFSATHMTWELGRRCEFSHEELTARIIADGRRIACAHALLAVESGGRIYLEDGLHRWTVATELGIEWVPVGIRPDVPQSDPAAGIDE